MGDPTQWPALDPPRTVLRFPLRPHELTNRVTPADELFVLAHLGVPRIDPDKWTLSVAGLVERPLELTYTALQALPGRKVEAFLQCAGNPATPRVPARLVANVFWEGVELAALLEEVEREADTELWCRASDAEGRVQPLEDARNAVHRVSVHLRSLR
jgi:DMSO/TMAO reductase YedYZ molybdopterin-dependent catalytic subunit